MNPQSCRVVGFKQPSREESAHDFLWRIEKETPKRGEVVIFNRSHYEDVLVVRVHNLVPKKTWSKRYEEIEQLRKAPGRQRNADPEILSPHQQRGAIRAFQATARRPDPTMENQRG